MPRVVAEFEPDHNTAIVVNALNRMLVPVLPRSPSSGTFLAQTNIRVTDAKWRARDLVAWTPIEASNVNAN